MHFLVFTRPGANSELQFSYPELTEIQKQTTDVFSDVTPFIFGGLAGEQNSQSGLTADGTTKPAQTAHVGGDFFSLLGIAPASGRFILSTEGKSAGADPVVVLSYSYWQTRFGDPAIVGKAVSINGHPLTVIGVAHGFSRADSSPQHPSLSSAQHVPDRERSCGRLLGQSQYSQHARLGASEARGGHETNPVRACGRWQTPAEAVSQRPRNRRFVRQSFTAARNHGRGTNPFPKLAALFLTLAGLVLAWPA